MNCGVHPLSTSMKQGEGGAVHKCFFFCQKFISLFDSEVTYKTVTGTDKGKGKGKGKGKDSYNLRIVEAYSVHGVHL